MTVAGHGRQHLFTFWSDVQSDKFGASKYVVCPGYSWGAGFRDFTEGSFAVSCDK